jgi:hypothetical protein
MKTAIINYFKNNRSYRGGVSLVQQFSIKLGLKKQLNIHPESDYLQGCVFEELREIAGISNEEMRTILSLPLPKAQELKISREPDPVEADYSQPDAIDASSEEKSVKSGPLTKTPAVPVKKTSRKK